MRRRPLRRISARLSKPALEAVESRVLLATFTVTNTTDTTSSGSLRWAIGQSNTAGGSNTIKFDIASSGLQVIDITSALPAVTAPVKIDGTTEPGYTNQPLIELDGSGAGSSVDGLDIEAGDTTVKGLDINQFSGEGINLSDAGGNTIKANFIGTDPTGTVADPNALDGILVQVNSNNNVITGNLISGNTKNGIYLNGQLFGASNPVTSGNLITGNLIGTDVSGTLTLGNDEDGICVQNAPETTIGGTTAATRNIISGNGTGMELYDNSDDSVIEGNYIGTDITGEVALGNSGPNGFFKDNIVFKGISNSTIGGTVVGAGNVISGGQNYGIDCFVIGSENLAIQGNLIGTDATGTKALPNKTAGINIAGPAGVTIGGTVAGARNIISGNTGDGITTFAGGAGLTIEGNYIGTDITGTQPLGNGGDGVDATYTGITVGGLLPGEGNIIANNGDTAAFDHWGVNVTNNDTPILSNSIYNNQEGGIELNGGNNGAVAPVLSSAVSLNTTSAITGSLSAAAGVYTLQFFSTPGVDPAGDAEGETLLGSESVTIVGVSGGSFSAVLPVGFTPGSLITATATDSAGNTSEFSLPVDATGTGNGVGSPTVTTSTSASSVLADQNVTDTFAITNPDTVSDTNVVFSDPIPAGTTFVSATTSTGATVTVANGVATATIGTLTANQTVTVSITLEPSISDVPSFTNTASILASSPPLLAGADTASVVTNVDPAASLAVSVLPSLSTVPIGDDASYVVKVTNNGPSPAEDVVLSDTLPAGLTFISAVPVGSGPSGTYANGAITDDYGTLAVGASFELTVTALVGLDAYPAAADSASVSTSTPDLNPANETGTGSVGVSFVSDVGVTIAPKAAKVGVGETETFTVTVTNSGPSPATDVSFTDFLPTDANFVSASASSGPAPVESSGEISSIIGTLDAGASVVYTIEVAPTGTSGSSIVDSASVTTTSTDLDTANESASSTVPVVPVADLAIVSLVPSVTSLPVGQEVTFTINVANNGPSATTEATITDTLPAGLTFVSGTSPVGSVTVANGVATATIGELLDGGTATITITATATVAGTLNDTATVSGPVTDPNSTNNSAATSVTATPVIDLAVALSGDAGPIFTGDAVTYTAVVTNNGPSPATNVVFTDPLYAGATFQSIEANQAAGSDVNGVATQSLGTIAAGASVTVTLTVIPTEVGGFTDTGSVIGTEPDSNLSNNSASVSTTTIAPYQYFELPSPTYSVADTAGVAAITIDRVGDPLGNVSVQFSTGVGTAVPGLDYQPVDTTVNFPVGVTSETVDVPILDNPFNNQNVLVDLQLSNPVGGGSTLEPNSNNTAILGIIDPNPVLVGPVITDMKLIGPLTSITAIELDTTGNLNPVTASYTPNYSIIALGGNGRSSLAAGTVVPVIQASYNASTGTVLLTPAIPLPANELFEVGVNGMGPAAVSDLAGNALNSIYGAVTGSDYILDVARGTDLNYTDQNGTAVTLKLTGPGTLDIDRTLGGELGRLQVVGGVAGKTVVSGLVHGAGKQTTIGTVLGLGGFGEIPLELSTPPFVVSTVVYPASQALTDTPAVDTLLPSAPTTTSTTPVKSTRKAKSTPVVSTDSKSTPVKAEAVHKVKTGAKHPLATLTKAVRDRTRR